MNIEVKALSLYSSILLYQGNSNKQLFHPDYTLVMYIIYRITDNCKEYIHFIPGKNKLKSYSNLFRFIC